MLPHVDRDPQEVSMRRLALRFIGLGAIVATVGCGGPSRSVAPTVDVGAPEPQAPSWRPGEAVALVLAPPIDRVRPIDDAFLASTADYRTRIERAEERTASLRVHQRSDDPVRRTWFFDGPNAVLLHIDLESDGVVDQAQYFGAEGLFAVVHHFSGGRRTQRIYWPPGQPRIVEIRDAVPPFAGVWWRSTDDPFPEPESPEPESPEPESAEPDSPGPQTEPSPDSPLR
jgi:hypothetical protein